MRSWGVIVACVVILGGGICFGVVVAVVFAVPAGFTLLGAARQQRHGGDRRQGITEEPVRRSPRHPGATSQPGRVRNLRREGSPLIQDGFEVPDPNLLQEIIAVDNAGNIWAGCTVGRTVRKYVKK